MFSISVDNPPLSANHHHHHLEDKHCICILFADMTALDLHVQITAPEFKQTSQSPYWKSKYSINFWPADQLIQRFKNQSKFIFLS